MHGSKKQTNECPILGGVREQNALTCITWSLIRQAECTSTHIGDCDEHFLARRGQNESRQILQRQHAVGLLVAVWIKVVDGARGDQKVAIARERQNDALLRKDAGKERALSVGRHTWRWTKVARMQRNTMCDKRLED